MIRLWQANADTQELLSNFQQEETCSLFDLLGGAYPWCVVGTNSKTTNLIQGLGLEFRSKSCLGFKGMLLVPLYQISTKCTSREFQI